jgi:hypothetical protein
MRLRRAAADYYDGDGGATSKNDRETKTLPAMGLRN